LLARIFLSFFFFLYKFVVSFFTFLVQMKDEFLFELKHWEGMLPSPANREFW